MKLRLPFLLIALLTYSCVYPLNINTAEYSGNNLVIDGSVIIGGTSTVTVSHLVPLGDISSYGSGYVRDAVVSIESDKGDIYRDDSSPYSINTENAPVNCMYRLVVETGGKEYVSSWIKPLTAPTITGVWFSADETSVQISLDANGGSSGHAAIQYDEIWKFHADYVRIFDYDPNEGISTIMEPDMTFYQCWRNNQVKKEILLDYSTTDGSVKNYPFASFARTNERFQYEYNLLVKIRNLSDEEYRYFKHLEDANDTNSLFSPDPGNAETNIVCESDPSEKVFGYVSISCQNYYIATINDRYYVNTPPPKLYKVDPEDYTKYYSAGFVPVNVNPDGGIGWGTSRCYNCVSDGGTLSKPEFYTPNQ